MVYEYSDSECIIVFFEIINNCVRRLLCVKDSYKPIDFTSCQTNAERSSSGNISELCKL